MKRIKSKLTSKIVCLAAVSVAIIFSVCGISGGKNKTAFAASAKPIMEGSKIEIYNNNDFSGGLSFYSTLPTEDWGDSVLSGHSVRFFTDYTEKNNIKFDTNFKNSGISLDVNGHSVDKINIHTIATVYDLAGGGSAKFYVQNGGVVTVKGGNKTAVTGVINSGGTLVADGNDKTEYYIVVNEGATFAFLSGRITYLSYAHGVHNVNYILRRGYAFVGYSATDESKYIPYSDTNKASYSASEGGFSSIGVVECSHDEISDGICVYCNVSITGTEALNTAKREIEKAKEELNNALGAKADKATLDQAMMSLNESIRLANEAILNNKDAADSEIADLKTAIETAKSEAIKTASDALSAAKEELNAAIAEKADAQEISEKITALADRITALETVANALGDTYATKTKVAEDIQAAKDDMRETAANIAQDRVDEAYMALERLIDEKASQTDLTAAVDEYKKLISDANALIAANKTLSESNDERITALEANVADLQQKLEEAGTKAASDLAAAREELAGLINENSTAISEINETISAINGRITALEAITNALGDVYAKKDDVANDIATAKTEVITAASNALAAAKEELNAAIAKKADATTIEAKIGDLNTSIINLEAASKSYGDEKSAELKADVQKDIDDAKTALQSAIDGLSARLEAAENKIGETENEVKFVKTFMLIISGLVAVLGALVIALAATLRRATKLFLNGKN